MIAFCREEPYKTTEWLNTREKFYENMYASEEIIKSYSIKINLTNYLTIYKTDIFSDDPDKVKVDHLNTTWSGRCLKFYDFQLEVDSYLTFDIFDTEENLVLKIVDDHSAYCLQYKKKHFKHYLTSTAFNTKIGGPYVKQVFQSSSFHLIQFNLNWKQ